MTIIQIQPTFIRDDDECTRLLTHLPDQIGEIHDAAFLQYEKRKVRWETYTPKVMPVLRPTIGDIEAEIRGLGDLHDKTQTASQILALRTSVWQELDAFHKQIESEKEEVENRRLRAKYDAAIADIDDVLNGEPALVDTSLQTTLQNIKIPFELIVAIDYDKENHKASISAAMPFSYCIPTAKTVVHSRGITIKNKMQREMQQEESECIIGLSMLLAGRTFSVTPNIKCVNVLFHTHRDMEALLAVHFEREKFVATRQKMETPSVALFNFPYAANIRTVREAMVLGVIPKRELQGFLSSTEQMS